MCRNGTFEGLWLLTALGSKFLTCFIFCPWLLHFIFFFYSKWLWSCRLLYCWVFLHVKMFMFRCSLSVTTPLYCLIDRMRWSSRSYVSYHPFMVMRNMIFSIRHEDDSIAMQCQVTIGLHWRNCRCLSGLLGDICHAVCFPVDFKISPWLGGLSEYIVGCAPK